MLVAGETQFNLIGFVLVMTASMLSGLRWTITQVLLQGTDAHGKQRSLLFQYTPFSTQGKTLCTDKESDTLQHTDACIQQLSSLNGVDATQKLP